MRLKIFLLFLLVLIAIGETIYLNLDAKMLFDEPKGLRAVEFTNDIFTDNQSLGRGAIILEQTAAAPRERTRVSEEQIEQSDAQHTTQAKKICNKKEKLLCQKAKVNEHTDRYTVSNVVHVP